MKSLYRKGGPSTVRQALRGRGQSKPWFQDVKYAGMAAIHDFNNDRYALPDVGAELISNGTFDTNISGWTNQIQATWNSGRLQVVSEGTNQGSASQVLNGLRIGAIYEVNGEVAANSPNNGYLLVRDGTTTLFQSPSTVPGGKIKGYFTATNTSLLLFARASSATAGQTALHDNISVKEVLAGGQGPELVVNGAFPADLSGWTAIGTTANVVWDATGKASITGDGTATLTGMQQTMTTVVGQRYTFSVTVSGSPINVIFGSGAPGSSDYGTWANPVSPSTVTISFVATTTTASIRFYRSSASTTLIDNVSLKADFGAPVLRAASRDEVDLAYTASSTTGRTYLDASGKIRDMAYGRTNLHPNSALSGTLFTPGPYGGGNPASGWGGIPRGDLAVTILGYGIEGGIPYMDVRWQGMNGATGGHRWDVLATRLAATAGETYTSSVYVALIEGNCPAIQLRTYSAASDYSAADNFVTPGKLSDKRIVSTRTVPAGATDVGMLLRINTATNTAYDFTLRIGLPQLVPGFEAGAPLLTTGTALTGVNQPRFDYSNGKQQLLLENQSTNRFTRSHEFENTAGWFPQQGGAAVSALLGLWGTPTRALIEDNTTAPHGVTSANLTWTAATQETVSVIAKAGARDWLRISLTGAYVAGNKSHYFNLRTGTLGTIDASATATIIPLGGGWYRCALTFTPDQTVTTGTVQLRSEDVNNGVGFQGIAGQEAIYVDHAQLEANPLASSPIRTSGAAVTRAIETFRLHPVVEAILQRESAGAVVAGKQKRLGVALGGGVDWATLLGYYDGAPRRLISTGVGGDIADWSNTHDPALGFRAAISFDAYGRNMAGNGRAAVADTKVPQSRASVQLARNTTSNPAYGEGWYDFLGVFSGKQTDARITELAA